MNRRIFAALPLLIAAGWSGSPSDENLSERDSNFSSVKATLVTFEFDGTLTTDSTFNTRQTIQDQLLYTIGHLNADNSVGRLDKLVLTNVQRSEDAGKITIKSHAKLPVAWGSKTNVPTSYQLALPKDTSQTGLQAFTDK